MPMRRDPRALLARLYGWRKRTENELGRVLLQHRYRRPENAPEVVRRVDELIATRQAINDEIASLKRSDGHADAA